METFVVALFLCVVFPAAGADHTDEDHIPTLESLSEVVRSLQQSVHRLQSDNDILHDENKRLAREVENLWLVQKNCGKVGNDGASHDLQENKVPGENVDKSPQQETNSPLPYLAGAETPDVKNEDGRYKKRDMKPRLLVPTSRNVAFSARMSRDVGNLTSGNTVVFDEVLTNIGNMYNPQIGDFFCYYAGVYVFFLNILSEGPHYIDTDITRNGNVIASTYSYDKDSFSSGSNMVIVHLDVGDRVWVKIKNGEKGFIIDFFYSTFSGFLLY